jgi:nitroreductase
MEGLETILTRRSIRKYEDRLIEEDKLKNILTAGMFAPSAHNSQPWEFIVVRDRHMLMQLSSIGQYWKMLAAADAAIVTLANDKDYKNITQDFIKHDCAAATENMLLAAHAQGLGGVWLGLQGKVNETREVRGLLGIPEEIVPFSIIALGYPAEARRPHTTYREEKVFFEKYEIR